MKQMHNRLIEILKNFADGTYTSNGKIVEGTKVDDIADLIIADGWIRPPCKVRQTVYSQKGCFFLPYGKDINPKEVIPCEVIAIKETKKGKYFLLKPLLIETFGMRSSNEWFPFSAIGKTVFASREEAEAKLKEGEG